jgi:hypothetical protein
VKEIMAVKHIRNGVNPFDIAVARDVRLRQQESSNKRIRNQIYACNACELVKEIGFENMDECDEKIYLYHLKTIHGIAP